LARARRGADPASVVLPRRQLPAAWQREGRQSGGAADLADRGGRESERRRLSVPDRWRGVGEAGRLRALPRHVRWPRSGGAGGGAGALEGAEGGRARTGLLAAEGSGRLGEGRLKLTVAATQHARYNPATCSSHKTSGAN